MVERVASDIIVLINQGQGAIVGYMNAHMEDFDGCTDCNGSLVLDLCDEQKIIVVNRENKYDGQVMWQCGSRHSCVSYALVSEKVYERLDQMMKEQ